MSFTDKVILITGSGSGIGAQAARHLSNLGGKVALVDRDANKLNGVADQIKKSGSPTPFPIVADITKDAQQIIDKTIQHFGKLDVLINCAGLQSRNSIETIDLAEYDRIMNTNVRGLIEISKLAVPHLEKTKGNILNVSSAGGLRVKPNLFAYCISKAAVNQITKSAALDLASKGIRVNAINPVVVRTPFHEKEFGLTAEQADELFDYHSSIYPVGRVAEVTDTAIAIEFLTKAESSFFTGVLLPVDGGALTAGA